MRRATTDGNELTPGYRRRTFSNEDRHAPCRFAKQFEVPKRRVAR